MRRSLFVSLVLLSGCLANQGLGTASAAEVNIYRMSEICLGMTEEEVFRIMRYPTREEEILTEEACYDIWFYITRSTALDQSELRPHNLTPLIFKDGVLVGRGYDYYNKLKAKRKPSSEAVSMSSKPTQPPKKDQPPKPEEPQPDEEKKYPWSEEDDRMIEQGSEQNFDYW